MDNEKTYIVIIDDRLWKSILSDIFTVSSGVLMMGIGTILDNSAMEVAGLILWGLWLIARLSSHTDTRHTIKQARKKLDDIESGQAS